MNRFFGMMPCNEIEKEEIFLDENKHKVIIQAGLNGYTIIYEDGSSQYEDIICSAEENFDKAFKLAESSVGKLTRDEQVKEDVKLNDIYNITDKKEFEHKVQIIADDWLHMHWFTMSGAVLHVDGYLYVMGEDVCGPGPRKGYAKINIDTLEVVKEYGAHDCPIKIKRWEYSNNFKGLMDEIFENELRKEQQK